MPLPRDLWHDLVAAPVTDRGARGLLADLVVREVPIDAPAPRDVDRPKDLTALYDGEP